jgi:hypothetical protein
VFGYVTGTVKSRCATRDLRLIIMVRILIFMPLQCIDLEVADGMLEENGDGTLVVRPCA